MGYKYNVFTGDLDVIDVINVPPSVPNQFVTDGGTAIPVAHVLNILGTTAQGISSSGAGNTVTLTIADATETQKGVSELATSAETTTGTDTQRTIVPAGLTAKLGTQTANAMLYGAGTSNAFSWTNALTDGQLVIGSTAGNPQAASLTQPSAGITIAGGANSVTFALADDLAGIEALATTGIVSRTAADTWAATSITQHSILIGDAGELPTNLGPLTNGQLVIGSTGNAPSAANLTSTGSTITITNGAGTINLESCASTPTSFVTDAGTAVPAAHILNVLGGTNISTSGVGNTLTINLAATIPVTLGGTGATTLTDHAVLIGSGTGAITPITVGNTGELLVGATGADPAFATIAYGNFTFSNLTAATPRSLGITNADSAAGSTAFLQLSTPALGDDNYVTWEVSGGAGPFYAMGVDNSDSDLLKITTSSDPSSGTEAFAIDNTTAAITFANAYEFPIADGTTSYPLVTDGAGNLDFTLLAIAGGGTGVASITDHALIVGSGTAAVTEIGPLTNGQLVVGSTGADPVAASLTAPAAGFTITGGAGTVTFALADDLSAVEGLATTGIVSRTAADTWAATTVTQHAILIGAASEVPTNLGPLTNGQLVVGSTGNAPVAASLSAPAAGFTITGGAGTVTFALADDLAGVEALATTGLVSRTAANTYAATTVTQHAVIIGGAAEVPAMLGPLTNGQLVIGSTGNAPAAAVMTSVDGSVTITNGAGTIDLAAAGGGLTYAEETGATKTIVVDYEYGANRGAGVAFALPGTAAAGTRFAITGILGNWSVTQGAGQSIKFGAFSTTAGAGGSLTATDAGDCITCTCIVANTTWRVTSSIGNITIV